MKKALISLIILSISFMLNGQNIQFSISKCCGDRSANSISWQIDMPFFPDQANNLKSSKGPIIDTIICYDWDTIIGDWIESTMVIRTYDTNNRYIERKSLTWDGSSWINDEKTVNTYTVIGKTNENITYKWDGSTWENDKKITYFYDPTGQEMEESVNYTWNGTTWENVTKSIYNGSAGIIDEVIVQSWVSGNWENEMKYDLGYDGMMNNNLVVVHEWSNNQWEEYSKEEYVFDNYSAMIEYVSSIWDGSAWVYEHMWEHSLTFYARLLMHLSALMSKNYHYKGDC